MIFLDALQGLHKKVNNLINENIFALKDSSLRQDG